MRRAVASGSSYVFGGLLALAAVGGIVAVLALGVMGGDSEGGPGSPSSASDAAASVKLPEQKTGDMKAAAEAAGCKLTNPEIEGSTHEDKDFKASDYKTNPPTSGNHNPDWYEDGIYAPGDTPRLGMLVHPLEHGRIEVQYKQGTPDADGRPSSRRSWPSNGRLPHAAVREHDRAWTRRSPPPPGATRSPAEDERQDVRRAADLPHDLHRQGPRGGSLGPS